MLSCCSLSPAFPFVRRAPLNDNAAVTSGKGGVGKTTSAASFAMGIAAKKPDKVRERERESYKEVARARVSWV